MRKPELGLFGVNLTDNAQIAVWLLGALRPDIGSYLLAEQPRQNPFASTHHGARTPATTIISAPLCFGASCNTSQSVSTGISCAAAIGSKSATAAKALAEPILIHWQGTGARMVTAMAPSPTAEAGACQILHREVQ
jgi:hypothetical protein